MATEPTAATKPSAAPAVTPAEKPAGTGKRRIILALIVVAVILASVWGFKTWTYNSSHESTDNAQLDGDIVPVLAKVGGYVSSISVQENQLIKSGTTLVMIDDQEYQVDLSRSEADLAAAQAIVGAGSSMGQAQAEVATASGQSQAVDARILSARANNTRAQADLARVRELAGKQIVSRQQLDASQATADAAAADLVAAEKQANAASAQISTAKAGVRVAEARLASATAARANARLKLTYTKISAPAGGFVSRKQVEVGQLVAPGQPLMSIVSDSSLWITANFKETQLGNIRPGQLVDIEVDAYNGCKAEGTVQSVSGATGAKFALLPPDNATGNFTKVVQRIPVRIVLTKSCDGQRPLRPGLSVVVHVRTS